MRANSKLVLIEFTIKEISDMQKSLNIKKSLRARFEYSSYVKKNTANTVSISLEIVFDYSIQTSTFPDHWKLAKVMSLFKKWQQVLSILLSIYIPT